MDTEHYKNMVNDSLLDDSYYEQLHGDPQKETRMEYNKLIKKYNSCLTRNEIEYLKEFDLKESQFYGLQKVHKNKTISEMCKTVNSSHVKVEMVDDLKLRPVVAGPSCHMLNLNGSKLHGN